MTDQKILKEFFDGLKDDLKSSETPKVVPSNLSKEPSGRHGHLDIVQWLHKNRRGGYSKKTKSC